MNAKVQKMSGEDRMSTPITVQPSLAIERVLTIEIVRVTERAAVAAARLRGRGNEKAADQAAVDAMRRELNNLPIDGTVVIGEGERDEAPMLFIGEHVGSEHGPKVDIAVDPLGQAAPDRDLLHVDVGRVEKPAGIGKGQHRQRVGAPLGGDRGAFQRVESDVDLGALAGPDLFADVEHRRLVALAFTDHHGAFDIEAVERLAHRVDRGLVGRLLVAASHQPRGRQRRHFGHPDCFEREIAIHLRIVGHGLLPRWRRQHFCAAVAS